MARNFELSDFNQVTLERNKGSLGTTTSKLSPIAQSRQIQERKGAIKLWKENPNITKDMLEEPKRSDARRRPALRLELQRLLKARGWAYYHTANSKGSTGTMLDLYCWRERIIHIEIKRTGKPLSDSQQATFDQLVGLGEEVYVWRPEDWGTAVEVLW